MTHRMKTDRKTKEYFSEKMRVKKQLLDQTLLKMDNSLLQYEIAVEEFEGLIGQIRDVREEEKRIREELEGEKT